MSSTIKKILVFLVNRGWEISTINSRFFEFLPPHSYEFPSDYTFYIPINNKSIESKKFTENVIFSIAQLYGMSVDDMNLLFKKGNEILKIRVHDEDNIEGKIKLTTFNDVIFSIKSMLGNTASFVIEKNQQAKEGHGKEVQNYVDNCSVLQTEKGSFITKIQLPSDKLLKSSALFNGTNIYSKDVNNKLSEVLTFVNDLVFDRNPDDITDEFLIENDDVIDVKILKDIKNLYEKTNIDNIEFQFHGITRSKQIATKSVSRNKLYKLDEFIKIVETKTIEKGEITFIGKIISFHSDDPDGKKNKITMGGIYDGEEVIVTAKLDSTMYRLATSYHLNKQSISVSGYAKRIKNKITFVDFPDNFLPV